MVILLVSFLIYLLGLVSQYFGFQFISLALQPPVSSHSVTLSYFLSFYFVKSILRFLKCKTLAENLSYVGSSLQNSEMVHFCCRSRSVGGTFLWQPKQPGTPGHLM